MQNDEGRGSGLVISDLHLFAGRSEGLRHFSALDLRSLDVLVLNGDIFDFKWSTLADPATTLAAALEWLREVLNDQPQCRVHFILGNHDCIPSFKAALVGLAAEQTRFRWHEYTLELSNHLFLHGDCANRRMEQRDLIRFREGWQSNRQRGALLTAAYRWMDKLQLTRLAHANTFPRQATVKRVAHYLDSAHPGWRSGTSDCYFGHTHLPFNKFEDDGIRFHNTGSAIHGQEFNPVFFKIAGSASTAGREPAAGMPSAHSDNPPRFMQQPQ